MLILPNNRYVLDRFRCSMELDQIVDSVPNFMLERAKEYFNLRSIDDAKAECRHALSMAGLEFARSEPMNG